LAGNAFGASDLVFDQIGSPAITFGHDPFFFRILEGDLLFKKMTQADFEPAEDGGEVKPFPQIQFFTFNNHLSS
jgi:hypothetical protein